MLKLMELNNNVVFSVCMYFKRILLYFSLRLVVLENAVYKVQDKISETDTERQERERERERKGHCGLCDIICLFKI